MQKTLRSKLIILGSLIAAYLLLLVLVPEFMTFSIYFLDSAVLVPGWLLLLIVTAVVVLVALIIQKMKSKVNRTPL